MRHLIVISVFLLSCLCSNAQTVFGPEGARWMYESNGTGQNPPRQYNFIYTGDTVIDGFQNVHILKEELRGYHPWGGTYYSEGQNYYRQSGDSIFQYVEEGFELSFDLGVDVGDTRVVYFDGDLCFSHDTMLIENIDTINYQGQQLKRFSYRLLIDDQRSQIEGPGYSGLPESQYVERLGFVVDHPVRNRYRCEGNLISEYEAANFVCYTDNELAANFPDTCNLFLGIEDERKLHQSELIYSSGAIQIKNAPNSTLRIYDILGKELFHSSVQSDNETIDINQLPNGILMIVVETEESRIAKKVIKSSD